MMQEESSAESHIVKSLFMPLVPLLPSEVIRKLLQRAADKLGLLPQVGGQEGVGVRDGREGSLQRVFEGLGGTRGLSVGVLDTSKLHETLDGGGSDKASATRGRDQPNGDGTTLSGLLSGKRVGVSKGGSPVSTTNGEDGELGDDDGGTNGSSDFLGGLDTETDVTLGVTDNDDGLKTGTLTGAGLLLDGLDLHNLIFQFGQEVVDNLELLDWQRMQVDFFHGFYLAQLDETTELSDGLPLFLLILSGTTTTTSTATTTSSTTTVTGSSARSKSASSSCSVGHVDESVARGLSRLEGGVWTTMCWFVSLVVGHFVILNSGRDLFARCANWCEASKP